MTIKYTCRLKGKRVLVLGGSSGIGFSIAEAAIEYGAFVIISSSSQPKIDDAVQRLVASYPDAKDRVTGKACDLANPQAAETNLTALLDFATNNKKDKLDHIAVTAGDSVSVPNLSEIEAQHLHEIIQVRVMGGVYIGKHASAYMNTATSSSITFTSGAAVQKPRPGILLQTIQGSALEGLVRSLAVELAPIRVNLAAPGLVETERWTRLPPEQLDAIKAGMTPRMLLKEFGSPEDVALGYIYFMQDKFVTGQTIVSDGGWLLG